MVEARNTTELVKAARDGDARAWDELVLRYAGLVVSVCRRFHLGDQDIRDVSQNVWLLLVEHLERLREPEALPGWLATTTRRECLRTRRNAPLVAPVEQWESVPDEREALDAELLVAEQRSALREAFAALPPSARDLVALLVVDPPLSYAEISRRLGMPIGSIGPTRARILQKLRSTPAIAALLYEEPAEEPPRNAQRRSVEHGGQRS